MDRLPQDPIMLLSSINMLLRDREYDSLEELCGRFDGNVDEVKATLLKIGYEYNEEQKQFK